MLHGMNNSVIVNALLSDICISEIGSCWKQGSVMVISNLYYLISKINHKFVHAKVRMAEWSKDARLKFWSSNEGVGSNPTSDR